MAVVVNEPHQGPLIADGRVLRQDGLYPLLALVLDLFLGYLFIICCAVLKPLE